MLNARGVVVLLVFSAVSVAAGWNVGSFKQDLMWRRDWTHLQANSVGMLCKGDRLATAK